tara:strand:+ start:276 stop:431 length:156 start_codon:yes stop_codon:yes gene_type:complete
MEAVHQLSQLVRFMMQQHLLDLHWPFEHRPELAETPLLQFLLPQLELNQQF